MRKITVWVFMFCLLLASLAAAQILRFEPNTASLTGAWSSTTAYTVGQGVTYNGNNYVCTVANTGQTPSSSGDWIQVGTWLSGVYEDSSNRVYFSNPIHLGVTSLGTPAQSATANLSGQVNSVTIAYGCTLAFPPGPSGFRLAKEIWITNGGAATFLWSPTPVWGSGVSPTLSTSGLNVIYCESINGWTTPVCWQVE